MKANGSVSIFLAYAGTPSVMGVKMFEAMGMLANAHCTIAAAI